MANSVSFVFMFVSKWHQLVNEEIINCKSNFWRVDCIILRVMMYGLNRSMKKKYRRT